MSRGFVGRVVGPLPRGSDGSFPEGAGGRATAVPALFPAGLAADPEAGTSGGAAELDSWGVVEAESGGVACMLAAPAVLAEVEPDVVVDDDAVLIGTGPPAASFLSSAEITPKVTPRPVSVAIAAVASAMAIGFFPGGRCAVAGGGGALECADGDDARRGGS